MSKTFDEERFEFFTAEDNFLQMHRIAEHLPAVKSQLLQDFWNGVEEKLKDKYFREGDLWKVKRLEPLQSGISKLMIYKPEWGIRENACPQIAISCERLTNKPFYGPFIHNREESISVIEAVEYLRKLPIANNYQIDSTTWYPFWTFTTYTFTDLESFRLILPQHKTEAVDNMANLLYEMSIALSDDLDYIHKHVRKGK